MHLLKMLLHIMPIEEKDTLQSAYIILKKLQKSPVVIK